MDAILNFIRREPTLVIGVIDALIILGASFGLPITDIQKGAVDTVLGAIGLLLVRSQVSPVNAPPKPVAPSPVVPPA